MSNAGRALLRLARAAALLLFAAPASADTMGLRWPQPDGPGSPVTITYSFSNLLDGAFGFVSPAELRAATEEALRLWASVAPLHFTEWPDWGPPPSDADYDAAGYAMIRIGHHPMTEAAHAFFPGARGLDGDIHLDTGIPWTLGVLGRWDVLEAITHELGHALGLGHIDHEPAIMGTLFRVPRYNGLGTAYLLPADIAALRALYGAGVGSVLPLDPVDPIPEPATLAMLAGGLAALYRRRRRRRRAHGLPT
ncbi:MAG TPA: matrixin family metalloprotease [Vicinamibacterales bacterium]|nr:matrixin family metalloprotease [Vicinamibacterales bacterium]